MQNEGTPALLLLGPVAQGVQTVLKPDPDCEYVAPHMQPASPVLEQRMLAYEALAGHTVQTVQVEAVFAELEAT